MKDPYVWQTLTDIDMAATCGVLSMAEHIARAALKARRRREALKNMIINGTSRGTHCGFAVAYVAKEILERIEFAEKQNATDSTD